MTPQLVHGVRAGGRGSANAHQDSRVQDLNLFHPLGVAEVPQLLPHFLHHVADVAHVVLLVEVCDVCGAVAAFPHHIPGERTNQQQRGSAGSSDNWHHCLE